MPLVTVVQEYVLAVAAIALFVVEAWAFIDALARRPQEFEAAGKQTKIMWLVILGVALAAHMIFWHPINLLNLIGAVASIVYLVDVRPAIRSLTRR